LYICIYHDWEILIGNKWERPREREKADDCQQRPTVIFGLCRTFFFCVSNALGPTPLEKAAAAHNNFRLRRRIIISQ
jgi:hypothetical protein